MLLETFIRKQLRLKAHTVTKVEETAEHMLVSMSKCVPRAGLAEIFFLKTEQRNDA